MGQDISRNIVEYFNLTYNSSKSKSPLRQKSIMTHNEKKHSNLSEEDIHKIIQNEYVRTIDDLVERRLGLRNTGQWSYDISIEDLKTKFFSKKS